MLVVGDQNLSAWTQTYTKLLISLRKEKDDLFSKGKVRKNVAWQRVAEKFNSTSQVIVTWEQCSNKWKKLEERYKKIQEHNGKTGNDRNRARHCDSLVANATKNQALATTFLELVASGRLTFTFFLHPFNLKGK